ncbi:MAG TPA: helix-turn-helix transcriptional regulator [Thermoanaerobaculia bacterium]|jgi:transcriptional regulator with XRE-family HTH domain|nr:helix-turn-helix transcriptional regulator [Thermoanaerobaculia bacterium]
MRERAGIEAFYGDAIYLLRWRRGWSAETLAAKAGVSKSSILNYEKHRTVPAPDVRRKIARALDVAFGDLDGLAADLWRRFSGLRAGGDRLAAEGAADLAAGFQRAALPLVKRFAAGQAAPPRTATEDEVRALAPVVRRLGTQDLRARVEKLPSLWRWPFVKLVGEESERAASVDAGRALELASFALEIAERIAGEEGWVCRVFGWAFLANARRVGNELARAEEALACSARLQADPPEGRPELPEPWRLLDLEASLRITQRRLPEALRLLDRAAEVPPREGPIRARILCKRSNALERLDDLEGSIAALREALAQIDHEAEPHLLCVLQFNLAERLACIGQAVEAAEMLPELRRLQARLGTGLNQVRMRWLEGKIDAGLGRLDQAIEALSRVREAFAKDDLRYDEAQAGMDLARLYLLKGWTAEVRRLVFQMSPVFKSKKVHAEARKALALFRRAVEQEKATAELAGRVGGYLRRAEHDPELRFEEAA